MKAWGGLLGALTLFFLVTNAAAARGHGFDFAPVIIAGELAGTHSPDVMYAHDPVYYNRVPNPAFQDASERVGFRYDPTPFVYPPLVASLAAKLTGTPPSFNAALSVWTWVSACALAAGLALALVNYLPRYVGPAGLAWTLIAACAFEPVVYGFWLGQTTAITFFMLMAAVTVERRRMWAAAGFLVAVAAFVKITPILIALIWFWRGRRRAAYASAAALAGLWVVSIMVHGLALNLAYIDRVIQIGRSSVLAMNNHSLPAFLGRFVLPPAELWQVQPLPLWLESVTLASGAAIVVLAVSRFPKRSACEDEALPAVESLGFILMLLVPNVAWTHYFLFLLPGIGVLLSAVGPQARLIRAIGFVAFAMCCRFVIPAQEYLPAMGAHLLSTAPTLAAALVAATLLWRPHTQSAVQ
jgi:hypothetical protein